MGTITKHQLLMLMVICQVGTTGLFASGIKAEQNAWIVVLTAMLFGLVIGLIYTKLQSEYENKNYAEILVSILGKWLGIPVALLYAAYWAWPACRILRETSELITLTFLPNTPLPIIAVTFALTSMFVLSLGFQVLGRTAEIIVPIVVLLFISVIVLTFISGNIRINNVLPVLSNGIKPVLMAAYPEVTNFPFSFIFIFSMHWIYTDDKRIIRKTTLLSILFSGLLITFISLTYITTLGVKYTSMSALPFIIVVKMINIGRFLSNLDVIGAVIIFLGSFFEMSLFISGVTLIFTTIFKLKKRYNIVLVCVCFAIIWIAIIFERNYNFHQWMYPFDTYYLHPAFLHAIPISVLLIHLVKKRTPQKNVKSE